MTVNERTDGIDTDEASAEIRQFRVEVPQADLDDLRERLARTRWPDELPNASANYGMPLATVKNLAEYWRIGYDWRAYEAKINAFPHFTTTIDGQNIHFIHVKSPEPDAVPLLLIHGWPSSVFDFLDMIGPLTDPRSHAGEPANAFDVVIPSIPGFGFSGPTHDKGWDRARIARAFTDLMHRLGYQRFGVHGGDVGSFVGRELGVQKPDGLVGVHVLQIFAFPTGDPEEMAKLSPDDMERLQILSGFRDRAGYIGMHSTRPQTMAYGLTDSPVGQLAWNSELYTGWGDAPLSIDRDLFLTQISIYWLTATGGSSARSYYEDMHAGFSEREEMNATPTGVAVFPYDFRTIRPFAERANNIVHWSEFDRGGHFAAMDATDLLIADIQKFFGALV
jgi:pimeloyl-ACP methyl ester carboxylesterase